jgi:hypothetical protein
MSQQINRRDFLKVLGVGGAATALVSCAAEPPETLIPYLIPPEEIIPALPPGIPPSAGSARQDAGCSSDSGRAGRQG